MAKIGNISDTPGSAGATINDSVESAETVFSSEKVVSLIPTDLADLSEDSTHRLVTDTEKSTWNSAGGLTLAQIRRIK